MNAKIMRPKVSPDLHPQFPKSDNHPLFAHLAPILFLSFSEKPMNSRKI